MPHKHPSESQQRANAPTRAFPLKSIQVQRTMADSPVLSPTSGSLSFTLTQSIIPPIATQQFIPADRAYGAPAELRHYASSSLFAQSRSSFLLLKTLCRFMMIEILANVKIKNMRAVRKVHHLHKPRQYMVDFSYWPHVFDFH